MELFKEIAKQVFNLVAVLLMVFFIFLCGFAFADAEACVKRGYLAKTSWSGSGAWMALGYLERH